MALLILGIGLLAVSVCSQAGVTVEVVAGDNVTLWCRHGLPRSYYLFWFKHTNNSVPVYVTCIYYSSSSSSSDPCYFITDSERVEMMVNSENSSLTIRSVNVSDSGLYYCSTLREKYMIYSNSTYLQIRERNQTSSSIQDKLKAAGCMSGVYYILMLVFGTVIVVLLGLLLLLIMLRYRTQQREDAKYKLKEKNEDQSGDEVNYAALRFSKKKKQKRHVDMVDPHVLYSSVRQKNLE